MPIDLLLLEIELCTNEVAKILKDNFQARNQYGFLYWVFLTRAGVNLPYSDELIEILGKLNTVGRVKRDFQKHGKFIPLDKIKKFREEKKEGWENFIIGIDGS